MQPKILNDAFQHPADGWYQIEARGQHPHRASGLVQVIDAGAARAIVKQFNAAAAAGTLRHGSEMLIDHEHFSDQPDQETRAYGWLQELQSRADGIYGRIRWTGTGKAAVDGGDYRFFSTEYATEDLEPLNAGELGAGAVAPNAKVAGSSPRHMRPLRLSGLTLTNMNNNRGQKPITNRSAPGLATTFAGVNAPADTHQNQKRAIRPTPKGLQMTTVCKLLGLSAEADEMSVHAAVTKLLNRGDITPDALATLRAGHQSLTEQNHNLVTEQADVLLDGCGVKDEKIRNRLKDGLTQLKNRDERLGYLADFGYAPGRTADRQASLSTRVLNRGTSAARETFAAPTGEGEQVVAIRIQNRTSELQGKGLKYDSAWNQARREVMGKA